MKTSNVRSLRLSRVHQTNTPALPTRDDLVARALRGDPSAVEAVARTHGPMLLLEAERVLGAAFKQESEDVVQDLFVSMLEGRIDVLPVKGRAIEWIRGVVRAVARKRLSARERDWGTDPED